MIDPLTLTTLVNGAVAILVAVIGFLAGRSNTQKVKRAGFARQNTIRAEGMENIFRSQVQSYQATGNYNHGTIQGSKDLGIGVDDQQLQWMAAEAYHSQPEQIPGVAWVPSLSDYEAKVFVVPGSKTAVIAYAGTRPTRMSDLWTDVRLASGHLGNTARVHRAEGVLARVSEAMPGYKIITTGHSLGGSLAKEVSSDPRVDRAVGFNTGYAIDHPIHRLADRFVKATRQYHVMHHDDRPKFKDYLNSRDVISIGAPLQNGEHTYYKKSWTNMPWKSHDAGFYTPQVFKRRRFNYYNNTVN